MDLKQYIDEQGRGSVSALARKVEARQSTISDILSGRRNPSESLARRIEQETGGAVTVPELLAHTVPEGYKLVKVGEPCQRAECVGVVS